jgi:hypothetical protein
VHDRHAHRGVRVFDLIGEMLGPAELFQRHICQRKRPERSVAHIVMAASESAGC